MALNHYGHDAPDPERDPALDRLYAAAPREEPSAGLDAAIGAAARRAVGSRPRALRSAVRQWRIPVSIAAVVVLSASLVALMKEEGADRLYEGPDAGPQPELAREAQRAESPPPPAAPASPPPQPAPRVEAPAPPAAPAAEADRSNRGAPAGRKDMARQVESMLGKVQSSAAPPTVPSENAAQASPPRPFPAPAEDRASARDAASSMPRAAPSEQIPAQPAAPPPAKVQSYGELAAKREEGEMGLRQQSAERPGPPLGGPAGSVAATPPPPAAKPEPRARAQSAPVPEAADASAPRTPVWSGFERQPPEKWIARIEELQRGGRAADARDMLDEFRKRFPDYSLPAHWAR